MNITGRTTAIGVFSDHNQAKQALEALHHAGFSNEQIGFITRHHKDEGGNEFPDDTSTNVPSAAAGAVGGGVIGGVVGAAVSLLIPGLGPALAGGILAAVFGAVAGGFAGSLISIGIPEEEAQYYQEQLAAGRTLVTVHAHGRYEEAVAIMRGLGAFDAAVKPDVPSNIETSATEFHNADGVEAASTDDSISDSETEVRQAVSPSRDVANEPTAYLPVASDPTISTNDPVTSNSAQ